VGEGVGVVAGVGVGLGEGERVGVGVEGGELLCMYPLDETIIDELVWPSDEVGMTSKELIVSMIKR
jgi:hypothetical protein